MNTAIEILVEHGKEGFGLEGSQAEILSAMGITDDAVKEIRKSNWRDVNQGDPLCPMIDGFSDLDVEALTDQAINEGYALKDDLIVLRATIGYVGVDTAAFFVFRKV